MATLLVEAYPRHSSLLLSTVIFILCYVAPLQAKERRYEMVLRRQGTSKVQNGGYCHVSYKGMFAKTQLRN